ncbi:MAG: hypothetical protein HFJ89_09245, partial [Oscillospiraceae bacterium]|nr:hypothetical protein [Oscillospiraceae bacterium]
QDSFSCVTRGTLSIAERPPLAAMPNKFGCRNSPTCRALEAYGYFALCGARQWGSAPLTPASCAQLDQPKS